MPKDTTPRSPYIGSSRGHPKPEDYDVLSAKEGAKRHHPWQTCTLSSTESGLQQYPWTTEDVQRFECRRPCQKTSSLADPISAIESRILQIRRGLRYEMCHSLNRTRPRAPVQNQQTSSVQLKMVLMPRSEMPICAPPRLSEVPPTLPLKQCQCSSD